MNEIVPLEVWDGQWTGTGYSAKSFPIERYRQYNLLDLSYLIDRQARMGLDNLLYRIGAEMEGAMRDDKMTRVNEPRVQLRLEVEIDAVSAEAGLEDGYPVADPGHVLVWRRW